MSPTGGVQCALYSIVTMSAIKVFVGLLFFVYLALADDFQEPSEEPLEEEWPECDNSFMDGKYSIVHPKFCDRFFACQNGIPYLMQCEDGFGYLPFRGCKLLHLVDCVDRPQLQRPRGNKECKRLYGIFNDPKGCGNFFKCVNGTAIEDKCPAPLMFDDEHKVCRDGSKEELDACKQPVLLGCTAADGQSLEACTWFHCPSNDVLPFGDHSRHPYPGHCNFFIICLKDGSIKVGGCERGKGFDDRTKTCEPEDQVKACPKGRDGASLLKDMHKNSSQGLDDSLTWANP